MTDPLIFTDRLDRELRPAPINPAWIRAGTPVARNALVATSADGCVATVLWECTAGEFDWHYGIDETVYILDGSVVIESDQLPPRRYGPGEVIFFRHGAKARWTVDRYIRKLAVCRVGDPRIVRIARAFWARLRSLRPARFARPSSAPI
jgi:uncharacterized cupin superfamily protein